MTPDDAAAQRDARPQRETPHEPIVVGITTDVSETSGRVKLDVAMAYASSVARAGGVPVFLAPIVDQVALHLRVCDAFVLTGGDDPVMEQFGVATDPRVKPVHPVRQEYELALLRALEGHPTVPVLGVCLGMQMMCLHAGGMLDQYMPDSVPTAGRHWDATHEIQPLPESAGLLKPGRVHSKHKQVIVRTGRMHAAARSDDGLIEAAVDADRAFYVGVQWHPERTDESAVGQYIFDRLVDAARRVRSAV